MVILLIFYNNDNNKATLPSNKSEADPKQYSITSCTGKKIINTLKYIVNTYLLEKYMKSRGQTHSKGKQTLAIIYFLQ